MKLRIRDLKRLVLREVALSPAVMKQEMVKDPLENKNAAAALADLERWFKNSLARNLLLANASSYNAETRDFDDAAYQRIEQTVTGASEQVMGKIDQAIKQAWVAAHQQAKQRRAA